MTDLTTDQLEDLRERPNLAKRIATFARKQPLGTGGAIVVILYVLMAILAPYLTPFDPTTNSYEYQFVAPNAQFWMGTDEWGRDILTRVIYGSRTPSSSGSHARSSGRPWAWCWASPAPISAARST